MRPFSTTPDSCASHAFAITKADADLPQAARGLYVGGTGDLVVTMPSGAVVTFVGVQAGTVLPLTVIRVANATTATNIVGLV
jgi:hypothetical protein